MVKYKTVIPGFLSFTRGIPNHRDYAVDKMGNVYNRNHGKILKPYLRKGYLSVTLCQNNKRYQKSVHRLILETFRGKCPDGMEACHNNGDKLDNNVTNLRWDTHKNNCGDRNKYKILTKFLSPYTSYTYKVLLKFYVKNFSRKWRCFRMEYRGREYNSRKIIAAKFAAAISYKSSL